MNVKELIAKLQTQNQDAQVILYVFEDFNRLLKVIPKADNQGEEERYTKGYTFAEYEKDNHGDYVILSDHQ